MSVCVLVPVYRGSATLERALKSLAEQSFTDFSVFINDDTPPQFEVERHKLREIISQFESNFPISFRANGENLGYPRNLMDLVSRTNEEQIFLLAQDDILSPIALESCVRALEEFPSAVAVSRPYFWFQEGDESAIRQICSLGGKRPRLVTDQSPWSEVKRVLIASSQLTGLMYRRSALTEAFRDTVFPAHIYPLAGAMLNGGVVYLPYATVAVSVTYSQTRHVKEIYKESPTLAWAELYEAVFGLQGRVQIEANGKIDHLGKNFVGLIQIRVYGGVLSFLKEALVMIKLRKMNFLDPRFLITFFGLLLLPRHWTALISDGFKRRVVGRSLRSVRLAEFSDRWWK
jgi:glycosyltransferase involved in cell wall biosynthesis